MKFLKRYYSELFSLFLFFPSVMLGMWFGVLSGLAITTFLVFFTAVLFRNYQITAFSVLLLGPVLVFRGFVSSSGAELIVSGVSLAAVFYLFCFSVLYKKRWTWMWYGTIGLWSFLLFKTISFDVFNIIFIFSVFYSIAYLFFPLIVDVSLKRHVSLHFFVFLFSVLLFEMFWLIRIFPLGVLFGPVFVMVFFYFFSHVYRGYCLESPLRYYIRPATFTFLSLLVILLTAINSSF